MTVKELIRKLQNDFDSAQEVFISDPATILYTTAKPLYSVLGQTVGRAKNGQCFVFVGALGPEACVLFTK
jgi:hypothetical protein